jgi:transposase-like protein
LSIERWRNQKLEGDYPYVYLGLAEAAAECFPTANWQRCTVHFYRNVFSHVPRNKVRLVAAMLKATHAQESREAAQDKARDVVEKLKSMRLGAAAKLVGAFPDGQSALMLVAARLRHVSASRWGMRKYMNMKLLDEMEKELRYSAA